jgi:hypothetical protein
MNAFSVSGSKGKYKKINKYLIDWGGKSRSNMQYQVKQFLKQYWQFNVVFEEFPVLGSKMTLDFMNLTKRVAVEVQGKQHRAFNKFFHNNDRSKFLQQLHRDRDKEIFCERNEIELITIFDNDSLNSVLFEKQGVIL